MFLSPAAPSSESAVCRCRRPMSIKQKEKSSPPAFNSSHSDHARVLPLIRDTLQIRRHPGKRQAAQRQPCIPQLHGCPVFPSPPLSTPTSPQPPASRFHGPLLHLRALQRPHDPTFAFLTLTISPGHLPHTPSRDQTDSSHHGFQPGGDRPASGCDSRPDQAQERFVTFALLRC